MTQPSLQYPIGRFERAAEPLAGDVREACVRRIEALPARLRAAVAGLDAAVLDTPYREGGWTPRQIVHHLADSHMNALIRVKLALTEERPTIKPYEQERWAVLPDVIGVPVDASLDIVSGVHDRLARVLRVQPPEGFGRAAHHPEIGDVTVDFFLQQYAWHGDHHTAQIEGLRARLGV